MLKHYERDYGESDEAAGGDPKNRTILIVFENKKGFWDKYIRPQEDDWGIIVQSRLFLVNLKWLTDRHIF